MATRPKGTDRRVGRTRQIIRQAFVEIVREKGLMGASIQAVTERANVSRGTFYAHYADKYELVDSIVREEFQRTVSALPPTSGWNKQTLQALIRIMLDYFKNIYQHHRRSREIAPLLEQALREELYKLIVGLLKQNKSPKHDGYDRIDVMAQVVSWMIFGAAVQWSQTPNTVAAELMAHDIAVMIWDGTGRVVPESQTDTTPD